MNSDLQNPDQTRIGKVEIETLIAEWGQIQQRANKPGWRQPVMRFLNACLVQGRWQTDPDDRKQLQELATEVAQFYCQWDGENYSAIIQTPDYGLTDQRGIAVAAASVEMAAQSDFSTVDAARTSKVAIEALLGEWRDLRQLLQDGDRVNWRQSVTQFLRRCVVQGRYYTDPTDRERLQELGAEVAEFYFWEDGEKYPDAVILPPDQRLAAEPSAGRADQESPLPKTNFDDFFQPNMVPPRSGLIGRLGELLDLNKAWADRTHVFVIEGPGGVGKSALVAQWVNDLIRRRYRIAGRPIGYGFGWSFYSGGRGTHREGPERFFREAWRFFSEGEPFPEERQVAKEGGTIGMRLAAKVRLQPGLLFLDGIEPFQLPERKRNRRYAPPAGALIDADLAALVKGLAEANEGLCVITTRAEVADLCSFREPVCRRVILQNLSVEDSVKLLQAFELQGPKEEFLTAAAAVQGHCLSLVLLATLVAEAAEKNIGRWRELSLLPEDTDLTSTIGKHVEHARRVIKSYDMWFAKALKKGQTLTPPMALLRLLGFFRGPARLDALLTLLAPPIPGLTDAFLPDDLELLPRTLRRLEECGLMFRARATDAERVAGELQNRTNEAVPRLPLFGLPEPASSFDAHPLVREYFEEVLRDEHQEAAAEGHKRLYRHYCGLVNSAPRTVDEATLLYRAVVHACMAGLHLDALSNVLRSRLHPGENIWGTTLQFGMFTTELAALAHFFERPWTVFHSNIQSLGDKHYLWYAVAVCLRASGRIKDAETQLRSYNDSLIRAKRWAQMAKVTNISSEINVLRGNLTRGEEEISRVLNEHGMDMLDKEALRSLQARMANIMHLTGRFSEASEMFRRVEGEHRNYEPDRPRLYTLSGYYYADFLISQARLLAFGANSELIGWGAGNDGVESEFGAKGTPEEMIRNRLLGVADRMKEILEWLSSDLQPGNMLYLGLARLAFGEALYHLAVHKVAPVFNDAERCLESALNELRKAAQMPYVTRGLIALASLRRSQKRYYESLVFLEEAKAIIDSGGMRLYSVDVWLEYSRLSLDQQMLKEARDHHSAAKGMVEKMNYHRHDLELDRLFKQTATV